MRFKAERKIYNDAIALYLEVGDRRFATGIEVKRFDEGSYVEPFMNVDFTAAQGLMDELWHVGLRPSEGSGSAGALAATERHLKDMQRLVFKGK